MNRIYLVRHGENTANLTKEFSHRRVDYSLTPKGILQAEQTAAFFEKLAVDEIYSSPLKRARETAGFIARPHNLNVKVLEAFREVNVGDLENRPVTLENWAIHDRVVAGWLNGEPELRFPDGENYWEAAARFKEGIQQVSAGKDGQQIVVAGHGGQFTFTLKHICPEIDLGKILSQPNHNCSISIIDVENVPGGFHAHLVSWASISHLHGHAAELVSAHLNEIHPFGKMEIK